VDRFRYADGYATPGQLAFTPELQTVGGMSRELRGLPGVVITPVVEIQVCENQLRIPKTSRIDEIVQTYASNPEEQNNGR
jgi:hypothetical protein